MSENNCNWNLPAGFDLSLPEGIKPIFVPCICGTTSYSEDGCHSCCCLCGPHCSIFSKISGWVASFGIPLICTGVTCAKQNEAVGCLTSLLGCGPMCSSGERAGCGCGSFWLCCFTCFLGKKDQYCGVCTSRCGNIED